MNILNVSKETAMPKELFNKIPKYIFIMVFFCIMPGIVI